MIESNGITITETVNAGKVKFPEDAAWDQVRSCREVVAMKGKKIREFFVSESEKAEILEAVMGPSGNLRAPTLVVGEKMVVGFHLEFYQTFLS